MKEMLLWILVGTLGLVPRVLEKKPRSIWEPEDELRLSRQQYI